MKNRTKVLLIISILTIGATTSIAYYIYASQTQPSTPLNPAISVITDQVRDLFFDYKWSGQTPPYVPAPFVRGKILVWDIESDTEFIDIETLLPQEKLARSSEGRITIFGVYGVSYGMQDVLAVYWPEKIAVGPYAVEAEIEDYKGLADWINSLPSSDALPASSSIKDIRNVILSANSTYPSTPEAQPPVLSGKVLVWDFSTSTAGRESIYVEKLLPSELVANSLQETEIIFAIVKRQENIVGHYSRIDSPFSGYPAIQVVLDVLVVHYPGKEVLGRYSVEGDMPAQTSYSKWANEGDLNKPLAEWIQKLFQT